jgi:hypothetical protein
MYNLSSVIGDTSAPPPVMSAFTRSHRHPSDHINDTFIRLSAGGPRTVAVRSQPVSGAATNATLQKRLAHQRVSIDSSTTVRTQRCDLIPMRDIVGPILNIAIILESCTSLYREEVKGVLATENTRS